MTSILASASCSSTSSSSSSAAEASFLDQKIDKEILARPNCLKHVAGHDKLKRELQTIFSKLEKSIASAPAQDTKQKEIYMSQIWKEMTRLPHLLLQGPPGVGKTSLAHIWIQELIRLCFLVSNLTNHKIEFPQDYVFESKLPNEPTDKQFLFLKTKMQQNIAPHRLLFVLLDDFENVLPKLQQKIAYLLKDHTQKKPWIKFVLTTNALSSISPEITSQCQVLNCLSLTSTDLVQHLVLWQPPQQQKEKKELERISIFARGDVRQAHLLWYSGIEHQLESIYAFLSQLDDAMQKQDLVQSLKIAQQLNELSVDWTLVYELWVQILPHRPLDEKQSMKNHYGIALAEELTLWYQRVAKDGCHSFLQFTGFLARVLQRTREEAFPKDKPLFTKKNLASAHIGPPA